MFYKIIATVLFIGYFPFAPGTVCSAVTMIFLNILRPSHMVILSIMIVSFIVGTITSRKVAEDLDKKDPSCVVIDEFTGYLTSILFIPITLQNLLIAFILFRIFDIIKPPPIRHIETKLKGGLSIMLDDIIAGLITNLLMRIFLI